MTTPSTKDALPTAFAGRRGRLFWLALKTGLLTVLTLGLYRFWMKTRLRRWYWSAIRPGGHPLEYTGDPFEKLLGFLIAVVFLAFYIGIVNLLLMFASYSLFQGNVAAYFVSFIGVIPLWFYAQYRARRYVLARTRWRGIRFGLEPGAWGYAWRALIHWFLTIVTAGLLLPRMTFKLEKYKTDRTFFGTARMIQNGSWTGLYRAMVPFFVAVPVAAGAAAAAYETNFDIAFALGILAAFIVFYGAFHYRVRSLQYLTDHKSLNEVSLQMSPSAVRITFIHIFGYFLAVLVVAIPAAGLGVIMLAVQSADTLQSFGIDPGFLDFGTQTRWVLVGISVALYFTIFLLWSALTHTFVTLPTIRHYATRLSVLAPDQLRFISQRARDEFQEAEGFAEALDVGASI